MNPFVASPRLDVEVLERLRLCSTATLTRQLFARGLRNTFLAGPGQVLVMDCRGRPRAASLGGILATRLLRRGAAGIVTDGGLRDTEEIRGLGLPTFAAAPAATTNLALHHAVDVQVPIGCAEVAVYPGDVIVGDPDGVVCIPRALAPEVADAAVEQERLERFIATEVDRGAPLPGTYRPADDLLARYRASVER